MNIYRPNVMSFLFPLLLGVAGIRAVFSRPDILIGFGVMFILTACGSGLWLVVDGYTEFWRQVNKFAVNNPDVIWAYLGLPKPSTTSRTFTRVNSDAKNPEYDFREINASEGEMKAIVKAWSSGMVEFSERKIEKKTGIKKTRVRQLQGELESAGYIRKSRAGDASSTFVCTARGARKFSSYLPSPTVRLQSNDGKTP